MVDVSSGVPSVKIPRLTSGPSTAVQAADNAAVQEVDAVSSSYTAPVATIAGQQDLSRQLFEFSEPGMDEVITDALARDFGSKFDSELVNGSAASGHTRGLPNVASTLSVTGAVSSVQAFIDGVCKAFLEPRRRQRLRQRRPRPVRDACPSAAQIAIHRLARAGVLCALPRACFRGARG